MKTLTVSACKAENHKMYEWKNTKTLPRKLYIKKVIITVSILLCSYMSSTYPNS